MRLRAACATGLIALAAAPAIASARSPISNRLHRADLALTRAQDAADAGNDAGVVRGLAVANRQTALALKGALRKVVGDRNDADTALSDTTDQLDANAQAAMDLLDGASPTVVAAANSTMVAADTGRGRVLTALQALGDLELDWGDALTQIADDAINELTTAADDYDGAVLSTGAENAMTAFVAHETDAAAAIVTEIGSLATNPDALLDPDALDGLAGDVADAADALGSVTGLSTANAATIAGVVTKLGALGSGVTQLSDAAYAAYDAYDSGSGGDWGEEADDEYDSPDEYDSGSGAGAGNSATVWDGLSGWGWAPRAHGYRGWSDGGFRRRNG